MSTQALSLGDNEIGPVARQILFQQSLRVLGAWCHRPGHRASDCQAHGCVDRLSRPESCMHSGVLEHLQAQRNASAHIYAHINSNFISVKPEREHWREEEKGGRETNAEGGLGAPPFALTGEINHCNYGPAQVNGDRSALSFPSSRCFLLIWASQALMPTDPWLMTKI